MNQLLVKKMNQTTKKKKKGFTLVELIIVIAIIAILAAIAIPKFGQIRENSNVKADIATAKNIQTAVTAAVANGDIDLDTDSVTLTDVLDTTTVPTAKAKTEKGNAFSASVSADGEVTVKAGDTEILPTPDGDYENTIS